MASIRLNRESIRWLILEGIAIVASILLAFAIEAWWQDRQRHAEEAEVFVSLLAELRDLNETFVEWDIFLPALQESGREIIAASASASVELTDEQMDALLSNLTWYASVNEISSPVMDSLVSTGELAQLSDRSLRWSISKFHHDLRFVRLTTSADLQFMVTTFWPFMRNNVSFAQLNNLDAPRPGFPDDRYGGEKIVLDKTRSHLSLLESAEFQNMLLQREWILDGIVSSLDGIETQLADSIALVEGALDD